MLGGLAGTADPTIVQIQNNLGSASTRAAYNNILASTLPTVNQSNYAGAAAMTTDVFDVAGSQLTTVDTGFQTGVPAGNASRGLHPWVQSFGSNISQNESNDVPGYDANVFGMALGVDTRNLNKDTVMGFSFAYGHARARQ